MKARLPKGVGGGAPGNMNAMIRQAQKMQEDMEVKQAEIAEREFAATVGGGMIDIIMGGDKVVKSITLKPDIVDPEDIEMLQDMIVAAVNEVSRKVEETTEAEMEGLTGGLNLPGMF